MGNEGGGRGKSAKTRASGQSKAGCLAARQQLQATLSMRKQDCAYLLNQKHKSKPAGGVSRVLFMQTAPSRLQAPLRTLFSSCRLIQTLPSSKLGVGQGHVKPGSCETAFPLTITGSGLHTLPLNRHFLTPGSMPGRGRGALWKCGCLRRGQGDTGQE